MRGAEFELDHLLRPAAVFDHPRDVLNDPDLTIQEKRAILSSWASDACAVESMPGLRRCADGKAPVRFDDIVDALRSLDDDPPPRPGGKAARLRPRWRRQDRDGPSGMPLS
jgi:hypothetical protein